MLDPYKKRRPVEIMRLKADYSSINNFDVPNFVLISPQKGILAFSTGFLSISSFFSRNVNSVLHGIQVPGTGLSISVELGGATAGPTSICTVARLLWSRVHMGPSVVRPPLTRPWAQKRVVVAALSKPIQLSQSCLPWHASLVGLYTSCWALVGNTLGHTHILLRQRIHH